MFRQTEDLKLFLQVAFTLSGWKAELHEVYFGVQNGLQGEQKSLYGILLILVPKSVDWN